jgi:hypothetical protein
MNDSHLQPGDLVRALGYADPVVVVFIAKNGDVFFHDGDPHAVLWLPAASITLMAHACYARAGQHLLAIDCDRLAALRHVIERHMPKNCAVCRKADADLRAMLAETSCAALPTG